MILSDASGGSHSRALPSPRGPSLSGSPFRQLRCCRAGFGTEREVIAFIVAGQMPLLRGQPARTRGRDTCGSAEAAAEEREAGCRRASLQRPARWRPITAHGCNVGFSPSPVSRWTLEFFPHVEADGSQGAGSGCPPRAFGRTAREHRASRRTQRHQFSARWATSRASRSISRRS